MREHVPVGARAELAATGGTRALRRRSAHPDAATIRRLFPANLYGAIVSFEWKDAFDMQL